jgi:uncharacterized protein (TIGR01777 family)
MNRSKDAERQVMKIFITGGSGFIGSNLCDYFLRQGHQVTAVGRSPGQKISHKNYRYISADTTQAGEWQKALKDVNAVVNLAGKTIFKRWSESYKKLIYDSRVLTTRNVVNALSEGKYITLCSASGAGYYGNRGDDLLNEEEKYGNDFLAGVSVDWEKEAFQAAEKGTRVVAMRFGVILGKDGGALAKMIPAFKFLVGGPIGSGNQWFPWMHLDDLMAAITFVLSHEEIRGPLNFVAPNPVRNRELAKALGKVLKRPAVMPAPAFMIRLALGEFGKVLLDSQRAVPAKLLKYGFRFQYPDIEEALRAVAEV